MGKRRDENNLWQNSTTKRWHWDIEIKRKDGSTFRKAGSSKDKSEALKKRNAAKDAEDAKATTGGTWTIEGWATHVKEHVWPGTITENSRRTYENQIENHILGKLDPKRWKNGKKPEAIGHLKLDSIDTPRLQAWINKLYADYGADVARGVRYTLSSLFTCAVNSGVRTDNPVRAVKLPRDMAKIEADDDDTEEGKVILTQDEQARLLKEVEGTMFYLPVLLGLRFGLRVGEALGLQWSHIDLEQRVLKVRQQCQHVTGKGNVLRPPKSKAGKRDIPIPSALVPIFAELKGQATSIFACPSDKGDLMRSMYISGLPDVMRRVGFLPVAEGGRGLPTSHDFRSSFASWMANESNNGLGVKPHTLTYLMGHTSIETTMRHYVRSRPEDIREAMERSA